MNVLQLISSEGFFGAENVVVQLTKSLQEFGCKSIVGVFENTHRPNLEVADQASRQGLPVEIVRCKGRLDWSAVRTIRNCIRENKIDVVHSHGYKSNLYGYLATCGMTTPLITTCHLWTRQSATVRLYDLIDGLLIRRFDATVAVSQAIADELEDLGVDRNKVQVISNGMNFEHLKNGTPSLRELAGSSNLVIGSVCRLTEQKGLTYLLDAVEPLLNAKQGAHLLVVGEGRERETLERIVSEKKISHRVSFTGLRRDIANVYASIDIFVLSSIDEGMPMALLEALASGKAIVATRVGDVPKLIIDGETGLLVEARDVGGLRDSLARLIEDPSLRENLGRKGQGYVRENFSSEKMSNQYFGLYKSLLENNRSRKMPSII